MKEITCKILKEIISLDNCVTRTKVPVFNRRRFCPRWF